MTKHLAIIVGTRPEAIKLAGVVHALGSRARVLHTGQHYDSELAGNIFAALDLEPPYQQLEIRRSSRAGQIACVLDSLDAVFAEDRPDAVLVQGDTNSAAGGALAANARSIPLVHVEAGLRSFDRAMPEEHNRVLVDHMADLCCAPTMVSYGNLVAEGIHPNRIVVTGNTVVEAVRRYLPAAAQRQAVLAAHAVSSREFVLATFHRPENTDDPAVLETILAELAKLPVPVVLPLHPRAFVRAQEHGLAGLSDQLRVRRPASYGEFLALAAECAFVISDSGGVQEEVSVLRQGVIVVRRPTERPEILGTFGCLVAPGPEVGDRARQLLDDLPGLHRRLQSLHTPYGDGTASAQVVEAVDALLGAGDRP